MTERGRDRERKERRKKTGARKDGRGEIRERREDMERLGEDIERE